MTDIWLIYPLIICFSAALFAWFYRLIGLNRWISIQWLGWLLSAAPFTAFILLLVNLNATGQSGAAIWQIAWMPTLGLNLALYFDGLSALFSLIITGIGALVVIYTGYYFHGEEDGWRFFVYLLLFTTSMLGVVLAGDLITLLVFWEGTSITSFLLIGYKTKEKAARQGAFKSLFITGVGGVALLAGALVMGSVAGSFELKTILTSGDLFRQDPLYPVILGLMALGAFTKSAQVPFHIWLPDAMSAPTPASAYLHSATMVKAGIYLMARLNPVLGFTDAWFWLLSLFGLITMLTGAYLGLKQNDLKALLAYSTISQLGMLMLLIGQESTIAFKALTIGIVAHALYKCALFLIAGIVDHATGTRDIRRLGGLWRALPITFFIGMIAALSMAGLPPLFGFIAKETLLATVAHPGLTRVIDVIFPACAVVTGAFIMAQAGLLIIETFVGQPRDSSIHPHRPPMGILLAPAVPAFLSLALGLLPEPWPIAAFLANAAQAAHGDEVEVVLAIWTGISVPLLLSVVAVMLGSSILVYRQQVRAKMNLIGEQWSINRLYASTMDIIDFLAKQVARVQNGKLRFYIVIMFIGMGVFVYVFDALPDFAFTGLTAINLSTFEGELAILRLFVLILVVATAFASVILDRDLPAILALGASGLAVAMIMALEPAPDIALVQVVVDILMTIILVLLLTRLPRAQRERAAEFTFHQTRPGLIRDGFVALGSGLVMAFIVFGMLVTRPRESVLTPFFEEHAKELVGATDIVGAILLDFRAFDTFFEIAVFALAAIGVYTLLRYASVEAGDEEETILSESTHKFSSMGIGGLHTSPFVRLLAYAILPLSLIVAFTHVVYGHDQPGDGFTAGVIVSLAVGLWYVVFGYKETRSRLPWLRSIELIGGGLLLVMISASTAWIITGSFFAPVDFGAMFEIELPRGLQLTTSLLFEIAICLTILGASALVIDTLGRPKDIDPESVRQIEEISTMEQLGKVTREDIREKLGEVR